MAVAQSNIAAQQNLIRVLNQQKAYQSVIAPFNGIITQRSVDVGSLVQAGTTFMFTLMQSDVIRTQLYVPQNAAFGVAWSSRRLSGCRRCRITRFPGR